jgi:hypothetical protein
MKETGVATRPETDRTALIHSVSWHCPMGRHHLGRLGVEAFGRLPCEVIPSDQSRFWARGFWVSTVGRDETVVRDYIRNQEKEDQRLEQMLPW